MVMQHYEVEIAYRREQLMQIRKQVGSSRRERRRRTELETGAATAPQRTARLEPVRRPATG